MNRILRVGSRSSRLAVIQTELVIAGIKRIAPETECEIICMNTSGDMRLSEPLSSLGGKGAFTAELESALLEGRIDFAVHSGKDMPMELPEGLEVSAVLKRENDADLLISRAGIPLSYMNADMYIGSSSPRREAELRVLNPRVKIKNIRGNVPGRIKKLRNGEYDGIILAAAGVKRLIEGGETGLLEGLNTEELPKDIFIPSAAQGILAVEYRKGELSEIISGLRDEKTAASYAVEREFVRELGADCSSPCAVNAEFYTESGIRMLRLNAMYSYSVEEEAEYRSINTEAKYALEAAGRLAGEYKCRR